MRSLPITQRIGLTNPGRIAALSAVLVASIAIPYQLQPPKASRLAVTTQPLSVFTYLHMQINIITLYMQRFNF